MKTLKELREEKGLSQTGLAKQLNVERSTYCFWESGRNKISDEAKKQIADFYNLDVSEIEFNASNQIALKEEIEEPFEEIVVQSKWGLPEKKLIATPERIEESIRKDLESFKKTFFNIGYKLHLVEYYNVHKNLGYETIEDYAKDKFNIGRSSTFGYMKVYRMARNFNQPDTLADSYKKYNYSQLEAMSSAGNMLDYRLIDVIKPEDDRDSIRKYIKAVEVCNKNHGNERYKWKTVQDGLNYLEKQKDNKQQAEDIPDGQLVVNDNSEVEDYNRLKARVDEFCPAIKKSNPLDFPESNDEDDEEPQQVFSENIASEDDEVASSEQEQVYAKLYRTIVNFLYDSDYVISNNFSGDKITCPELASKIADLIYKDFKVLPGGENE